METKSLLFGISGLLLGGLIVSIAATTLNKPAEAPAASHMTNMDAALMEKSGDDYDKLFLDQMILHHQGALDTAEMTKAKAKHDELKHMADEIIKTQQKEIDQMKQWQVEWGYTASGRHDQSHVN